MIAHHGTIVQGLKRLEPFAGPHSRLKYPCVYLSANQALAAIYIWKHPFRWMTFDIADNGIPIYNESFEGALRELYGGVRGCIYTCDGDFAVDGNTTIKHAVVSKAAVDVVETDIVENAYERIMQCEKDGLLKINRHDALTDREKENNRNMVMSAIKGLDLLKGEHVLSGFVASKFPDIWEEARRALRP